MSETGLQLKQGGAAQCPHPLFAELNRARSLDELLHIQLIDLPLVSDDNVRLSLREALQARWQDLRFAGVNCSRPTCSAAEHQAFPSGRWG